MALHLLSESSGKKQKPNISLNTKEQKCFATAFLKSKKPIGLAYQKLVEAKCIHKTSSQEK